MTTDTRQQNVIELPVDIGLDTQQEYVRHLKTIAQTSAESIRLDCSKVEQITSTHVNMLWRAYTICQENGLRFELAAPTDSLLRVLDVLDLSELFGVGGETPSETAERHTRSAETARHSLKISVTLSSEQISMALKRLNALLRETGVTSASAMEVETIFYEIATNVRLHSGLKSTDSLQCLVSFTDNEIMLEFVDQGRPFDPSAVDLSYDPRAMISNYQKRGLGLVMIRRMADRIEYERRHDNQNVVKISKHWR